MTKTLENVEDNFIQFIHIKKMSSVEICRNTSHVVEVGSASSLYKYIYIKDGHYLERINCHMTLKAINDIFKNTTIEVAGYSRDNPNNPKSSKMIPSELKIEITDENLSKTLVNEFCDKLSKMKDLGFIKIRELS